MRFIKRSRVYLIMLGLLVFAAGLAQAGVIEEWARRYNGSANDFDYASSIAIDDSNNINIYVTGTRYDSDTWEDYATIKYGSDGNQIWVRPYNGPGSGNDNARDIALDSFGNIYVTGSSSATGTDDDYATIKYDSDGIQKWVARYDGPISNHDYGNALAIDSSDNVYVTGISIGLGTGGDYATIKYDSNGNQKWVARYNGPQGSGYDWPSAIAIDGSGNIYVTGKSTGSGTSYDYATIKYNSAGVRQWVRRYDGPGSGGDEAKAIVIDDSDNIYVTGKSTGSGTSYDYATIKYNSAGVRQWVRRYDGPGSGGDEAKAIVIDNSDNIYVTGKSTGSGTDYDCATIKYDSAGVEQWVARYNGPVDAADGAIAITLDNSGNVFVTGESIGSGTGNDYATIKYDPNSSQLWVIRYNGPGNDSDYANAVVVDSCDYIYVAGGSSGSGTGLDYATIKYNQYPPFVLTMQTEPPEVNTVTPLPGDNLYAQNVTANISAQRFVDCPNVYVFDHWEGDVNDPNSANTTIIMDANETVTAVFVDDRQCGDECHPYPDGDTNEDCEVNFRDFALFAVQWLECTKPECD